MNFALSFKSVDSCQDYDEKFISGFFYCFTLAMDRVLEFEFLGTQNQLQNGFINHQICQKCGINEENPCSTQGHNLPKIQPHFLHNTFH